MVFPAFEYQRISRKLNISMAQEQQGLGLGPFVHEGIIGIDICLLVGDYSRPTRFCRIAKVIHVYSQVEWFYELGPGSYPDLSSVFPYGFFSTDFFSGCRSNRKVYFSIGCSAIGLFKLCAL